MALYTVPTDLISLPSALGGELLTFDATGSSVIVAPGSDGDILSVVAGLPAFIDPNDPGVNLSIAAANVTYDNAISGLTATDVQAALDEIVATGVGIDISSLTIGTIEDGDYIAFQDVNGGDVTLRTTVDQLATLLTSLGVGGGAVNFAEQVYVSGLDFNAPGPDTTLTLPATAAAEQAVFVFFDGIFQNNTVWSLGGGGNDIIFAQPIPSFVTEIEVRVAEDTAGAPVYMEEVRETAPFVGTPYDIALPADPVSLDNVWVFFNGIYQANDGVELQLIAGPTLRIVNGVPAEVTEVLVKIGSTVVPTTDLSTDTAPQLGGNLDVNNFDIVSTTNADIDIIPDGIGNVNLGNYSFDVDQTVGAGEDGYVLTYNDTSGLISLVAAAAGGGGGLLNVQTFIDFITPQTYTATPGTNSVLVIATGGGGSSASSTAQIAGTNSTFDAGVAGVILGSGGQPGSGRTGGQGGTGSGGFLSVRGDVGGWAEQAGTTPITPLNFAYSGLGGASFWGGTRSSTGNVIGAGGGGTTDGSNVAYGGGGGGGTAMGFFNSGFDGATVTVGAGGNNGNAGAGFRGEVVVFEFG